MSDNKTTNSEKELAKQLLSVLLRPMMYLGPNYTERELIAYLQGLCHGYRDFNNNALVVMSISTKISTVYDMYNNNDLITHLIEEMRKKIDNDI